MDSNFELADTSLNASISFETLATGFIMLRVGSIRIMSFNNALGSDIHGVTLDSKDRPQSEVNGFAQRATTQDSYASFAVIKVRTTGVIDCYSTDGYNSTTSWAVQNSNDRMFRGVVMYSIS